MVVRTRTAYSMKSVLLLGAGSSVPAGFPSTQCLTKLVVSGTGFERHTNGTFGPSVGAQLATGTTRLAVWMARRLYAETKCYFSDRGSRCANYEDLFYLAKQALDEQACEAESPAIRTFVDRLKADASSTIDDADAQHGDPIKFKELLEETCNYIADIVWHGLCRNPTCTNHLQIFAEACRSGHIGGISTLCHDVHVEEFLAGRGVRLADGFSEEETGVRYWDNAFPSHRTPFLKLHGSVNWFRFGRDGPENSPTEWSDLFDEPSGSLAENARSQRPNDESFFEEWIGIPLDGDHHHPKTASGDWQTADDGRPIMLVGTFNKISEYTRGMFRDIHHRFRTMLREVEQLVVCGYSFGDKGINSEIIGWYYAKRGRRIVVIDPNRAKLVSRARRAIRDKWGDWESRGSVAFIEKRLEEVGRDEFMRLVCA